MATKKAASKKSMSRVRVLASLLSGLGYPVLAVEERTPMTDAQITLVRPSIHIQLDRTSAFVVYEVKGKKPGFRFMDGGPSSDLNYLIADLNVAIREAK